MVERGGFVLMRVVRSAGDDLVVFLDLGTALFIFVSIVGLRPLPDLVFHLQSEFDR